MHPLIRGPVQIAYHVADIRQAAMSMVRQYGAGPFFIADRIPLASATHRGEPCDFMHSSAYGQSGELMVELVQQDEEGPSPFRDMYACNEEGLHHLAYFTADLNAAVEHLEQEGIPLATRAMTASGVEFAFMDATERCGHMLELYSPEAVKPFYEMVAASAATWNGDEPIRQL